MVVVLVLAGVLGVLFFREVLPIPLTALLAAVVLMVAGILTPEEGLSGLSNQATVAVMSMFVLSAGIQRSGAVETLTRKLAAWAGDSHRKQILSLGLASGPISGFVNNTPVVAVMIPAAIEMAKVGKQSASKLLMPLSHLAMLGGLLTIIGTSTSLLGNATLERLGYEPFAFFEFTVVGAVALVVGMAYYLTLGARLLPDRGGGDAVERFDLGGFLGEFKIPEESPVAGKTFREAGLSYRSGCQVLRLQREGQTMDAPSPRMKLREGDAMLIMASRERLVALGAEPGLHAVPEIEHPLQLEDTTELVTAEVVITTGSPYIGRSVADIDFRGRYQAIVLAVRHQGKPQIGSASKARLRPGDVLLVQASPPALERMREKPGLYVTRERERAVYRTNRLPHALAIVAAVVAASAFGWLPISVAALTGAALMVITGCLNMDEFIGSIRWDVVLLLAGIIPLGIALEKTGAAALLAQGLIFAGAGLPPLAFLILLFFATSLITEVASNNASVVLLVPIAVTTALGIGIDPRPVALTVMLAASTSMMTPVGYQTNTMIFAPGNYKFSDYARVGGPLNLLLALVVPLMISLVFPL